MSQENKILARVKKMLALGNDAGATEAERDTAMKMAYNLLAKYNLSIADLPADQNDEARELLSVVISADKWARSLAHAVAKLFFCKYWFSRTGTAGKDSHQFVGRQSNTLTAMHMTEYLIKSIKKEATRRFASPTSPDGRSFCVGAVDTIYDRVIILLQKGIQEEAPVPEPQPKHSADGDDAQAPIVLALGTSAAPAAEGTSHALALTKLHEAEKEANNTYAEKVLGVETKKEKGRADNRLLANAYDQGSDFGNKVSLTNQIAGSAPKRVVIK